MNVDCDQSLFFHIEQKTYSVSWNHHLDEFSQTISPSRMQQTDDDDL